MGKHSLIFDGTIKDALAGVPEDHVNLYTKYYIHVEHFCALETKLSHEMNLHNIVDSNMQTLHST